MTARPTAPSDSTTPGSLPAIFPVLLAVTQDDAANAAIRVTKALARERGAVPTVLSVVDSGDIATTTVLPSMGRVSEDELSAAYQNKRLAVLEAQVQTALGDTPAWRFEIAGGEPAWSIVERARELHAALVVLGFPHHTAVRRAFMRDTVQGVVEHTTSAVLAVRPALGGLPNNIMVAVDFSAASLRAARLARRLLDEGGKMTLVYVRSEGEEPTPALKSQQLLHEIGLDAAFTQLIDDIDPSHALSITRVVYHGSPVEQIKTGAERLHPNLIALGATHHTAVDWFFGDSVSTELVSDRRWSLLVAPATPEV